MALAVVRLRRGVGYYPCSEEATSLLRVEAAMYTTKYEYKAGSGSTDKVAVFDGREN